jgi:hypothetical protein
MVVNKGNPSFNEIREASERIVLAVAEDGMLTLFNELVKQFENQNPNFRFGMLF